MSSKIKAVILTVVFVSSWVLFPLLTYGSKNIFTIIPLILFFLQIFLTVFYKSRILLILILFNPVGCCAVFNIIKPTVNYIAGKPTKVECSYSQKARFFDEKKAVYWDYWDDDCDWEGLYCYTIDINNFVTDGLIKLFGNPLASALLKRSTAHNMGFSAIRHGGQVAG